MSFCAAYCQKHASEETTFERSVFWQVIYPHARLIAFFGGDRSDLFSADRGLISYCGRLTSLDAIERELAEFASLQNRGFLRRSCRIRISGRRLKKLAAQCLTR